MPVVFHLSYEGDFGLDASFLLTVEVFWLTVRFFTYGGGTVSKNDQNQFPAGGEP